MTGASLGDAKTPQVTEPTRTDQIHEHVASLAVRLDTVHTRVQDFVGRISSIDPHRDGEGLDAPVPSDILSHISQQCSRIQTSTEQLEELCVALERVA